MADRTSAEIFGNIFDLLAENPTEGNKILAYRIYDMNVYDFSDCQMGADKSCLVLGIAKMGINPEYPEDGIVVRWPGEDGYDNA